MKTRGCADRVVLGLLGLLVTLVVSGQMLPATQDPQETGPKAGQANQPAPYKLSIRVILVGADLSLRPVPKRALTICAAPDCTGRVSLLTSFEGDASTFLAPGSYRLVSGSPVDFEGKSYSWSVDFTATEGGAGTIELSNDNASVTETEAVKSLGQVVTDEGKLFLKVKVAVFTIEGESASGSGFLVDRSGLILTNSHVVRGSSYLAVKIDPARKYPGYLVSEDQTNDVAVIRVHPDTVQGISPLALAEDSAEASPVSIGERVVAIGSPLGAEGIITSGIVSKIEQGAILSDVNINHGNSGGPLFDLTGRVVGITTFMLPTSNGPGVSGIVRSYLAQALLAKARKDMAGVPPPRSSHLPVESSYRFPAAILQQIATTQKRDPKLYHMGMGPIDVQFVTPVVVSCLQVEAERELAKAHNKRAKKERPYEPGKDFYEWRRYTGDFQPIVTIQAIPEIGMTGGSVFMTVMFGRGVHQKYEFKTDFKRMELLRDGTLVEPIHPGRIPASQEWSQGNKSMTDITSYGAYKYPPEAFRPGSNVLLRIWDEKRENPRVERIPERTLRQLWQDFAPYFDSLQKTIQGNGQGS